MSAGRDPSRLSDDRISGYREYMYAFLTRMCVAFVVIRDISRRPETHVLFYLLQVYGNFPN